ncbi:hypothetical protein COS83_03035 [archaeon CG07_land_8_20_14_0_80_38_8]|nr:MAG: hypothetical protein COS83_03035 [archaeon CG07_land_8_20_14_0_80_38_8]PIU89076.1 MAG: hypothetical protein COS64_01865 [archaeon CG06_land_8_20_14_3_00_37_11]
MGFLDDVASGVKNEIQWSAGREVVGAFKKGVDKIKGGGAPGQKRCPKCKAPISEGLKFCPKCGAKLIIQCSECNSEYPVGTKFCTNCGKAL